MVKNFNSTSLESSLNVKLTSVDKLLKLDHAVTAIGYGYDKESGLNYYLVKNSWGSDWGNNGFIKLWNKGDGEGTCGI